MNSSKTKNRTLWLVELAVLVAIMLIMSWTPLGYLRVLGLEISFLSIPIIIGAVVLGPVAGLILGTVFGVTSFIQCFGQSVFGATLLGINPVVTFLVCVPTRMLAGFLTGVIYRLVAKKEKKIVSYIAASVAAPLLNTIFFMSVLVIGFWGNQAFFDAMATLQINASSIGAFVGVIVGVNGLLEIAAGLIVGTPCSKAVDYATRKSGGWNSGNNEAVETEAAPVTAPGEKAE